MALGTVYMKRLKHILQHRYLFKILAILILIMSLIITKSIKKESVYTNETKFIGTIYKIKVNNDKTIIYINALEKLIIYYYNELSIDINLGDTIEIIGTLSKPKNNTIPNGFNYQRYLYNNDIFYIINATSIKKVANNTSLMYYLKAKINNHISKICRSPYLQIFILGDSSMLPEDIMNSYRQNGISHLFSISGMHISLFASFILYVLKRLSYNNYFNYSIVILFLFLYSILVGATPSVIRSLIMYILFTINKLFNLKIKKLDIMCIVLAFALLLNPYYLYNISFIYSYMISFSLVMYHYKIKNIKNTLLKPLYTSLTAFMVSLPICLYYYGQVNFFSIILNIFFIPLVSIIIFPLSLVSFFIPVISHFLNIFISILEHISLFISRYKLGICYFSKPGIFLIFIYYVFIYLFLYNKKYIYIIIIIVYHKYAVFLDPSFKITFLDVGQGDSIFIRYPYNKNNILIDTGGKTNSEYKITLSNTIPYLRSIGVNQINELILTHGDFDHMGEAINLVNNFKVEKVIFNCGPYNALEKELIKVLDKKKIKYYSCIKELNIDSNKLYFLQTKEYDNENDNSNVIYTELNGYKFMFMGDVSVTTEKEIIDKYNLPNIDVLKVGHHGSKTSSGKDFINEINPKYSVISVGKNNRYGHPNKEVLDNLDESKIYRTDQDGSIMFKIKNNKLKIETCSP